MKYLLDTNICIYIIKNRPVTVFKHFELLRLGDVGISTITLAELRFGVAKSQYKSQNNEALERFILPLEILQFDSAAAYNYGLIRAELERKGTPIGSLDTLLASQAIAHNLTFVTNNVKEFSRVSGLSIENWTV